ncbi:hypothetical protein ACVIJ6_007567 [Bradyrhizobium sp. USDA 4369]
MRPRDLVVGGNGHQQRDLALVGQALQRQRRCRADCAEHHLRATRQQARRLLNGGLRLGLVVFPRHPDRLAEHLAAAVGDGEFDALPHVLADDAVSAGKRQDTGDMKISRLIRSENTCRRSKGRQRRTGRAQQKCTTMHKTSQKPVI